MTIKEAVKSFQASSKELTEAHISYGVVVRRWTHWEGKGKNKRMVQDDIRVVVDLDEIRKKESAERQEENRQHLEKLFKDDNTVIVPAF